MSNKSLQANIGIRPSGFCPKCKKYVSEITNKPDYSFIEIRKWKENCYELMSTNADVLNWTSYCGECGTEIEYD